MANWSADKSGRFPQRLFLPAAEIDRDCERLVAAFLREQNGDVRYPLTTGDLIVFVEQYVTSIDHYADLTADGDDVEGVTRFAQASLPHIQISKTLSEAPNRENRLRTTLAHEFGHAFYHRAVFDQLFAAPARLFPAERREYKTVCKRATMVEAREFDWLEWQAGYVCGAVLMPASVVRRSASDFLSTQGLHGAAVVGTPTARNLERRVMDGFLVSAEAARARLRKLGLLSDKAGPPTLFG
ncbi:MAG: ImmA/IrrE family metallo-endopeptidase [Alphaproteobacteria bacterium]|nr:ImmA/IrrE family metallo-endopeptidase [Alphaproteobacteria bacterium]